jgi:hypothetical protein
MGKGRFWHLVRRHLRAYLLGYAAALGAIGAAQASPWVLRAAVDRIQGGQPGVESLAAALLALALVEAAFSYAHAHGRSSGRRFRIETELRRGAVRSTWSVWIAAFFHRWQHGRPHGPGGERSSGRCSGSWGWASCGQCTPQ